MKNTIIIILLFVLAPIVYSQEYTLKDLKVNGKVKKITQFLYGSGVASDQIDTLNLINQTTQFFNEMGYLTLDSGVTYWGENFQKEVYTYDSLNRLTHIITYDKGFDEKKFHKSVVQEFRYDQKGNLIFESHSIKHGGTSITKSFYNHENKIIFSQGYYLYGDSDNIDTSHDYKIYEYNSKQKISKSYNSDSTLSSVWIDEFENENSEKISKTFIYDKLNDSLELNEKLEYFYEDSTKLKVDTYRITPLNSSKVVEYIEYYDNKRRLVKEEIYFNTEISSVTEYFYDELGNCIKRASHNIIPMAEQSKFSYMIYKYEFY